MKTDELMAQLTNLLESDLGLRETVLERTGFSKCQSALSNYHTFGEETIHLASLNDHLGLFLRQAPVHFSHNPSVLKKLPEIAAKCDMIITENNKILGGINKSK